MPVTMRSHGRSSIRRRVTDLNTDVYRRAIASPACHHASMHRTRSSNLENAFESAAQIACAGDPRADEPCWAVHPYRRSRLLRWHLGRPEIRRDLCGYPRIAAWSALEITLQFDDMGQKCGSMWVKKMLDQHQSNSVANSWPRPTLVIPS